jgi:hypothetical protein
VTGWEYDATLLRVRYRRRPFAVRCEGSARYALRCKLFTLNPSALCDLHADQQVGWREDTKATRLKDAA